MGLQDGFDFGRVDILSTGDYEVSPAVKDIEVAFVIKVADITCSKPAVLKCLSRYLGAFGIAGGDGWAFQKYLTRLTRGSWLMIVQNAQLYGSEWAAG